MSEAETQNQTTPAAHPDSVVVLDYGSQYSQLITRRVRECGVYCELLHNDVTWEQVAHLEPKGVILSGGPNSVYEAGAPGLPAWVLDRDLPTLGICYGMNLLAHALGGARRHGGPGPGRAWRRVR